MTMFPDEDECMPNAAFAVGVTGIGGGSAISIWKA